MSEATAYTPGPWRVTADGTDILALEGTPSALVVASTKFFEGPSTSWERANAQLIAAAPELLEALKEVVGIADRKTAVFDRARAAIAKAEGRGS